MPTAFPLFLVLLQLTCCIYLLSLSLLLSAILPGEETAFHSVRVTQPLTYRGYSVESKLAGTEAIHVSIMKTVSPNHHIFKLFAFTFQCEKKTLLECHFIFRNFARSYQYGTRNPVGLWCPAPSTGLFTNIPLLVFRDTDTGLHWHTSSVTPWFAPSGWGDPENTVQ